jgi:hypothetical protein
MSWQRWVAIQQSITKVGGSLKALGLNKTKYLVLESLANHENEETGRCDPSSQTVAKERDLCDSTVRKAWCALRKGRHIFSKSKRRVTYTKRNGKLATGYINDWGWNEERYVKVTGTWEAEMENASGLRAERENASGLHKPSLSKQGKKEVDDSLPLMEEGLGEKEKGGCEDTASLSARHVSQVDPVGNGSLALPNSQKPWSSESLHDPVKPEVEMSQPENPPPRPSRPAGPTLPVLMNLLALLAKAGLKYPRRIESCASLESRLREKHSPEQLLDLEKATTWIFTPRGGEPDCWRVWILQPNKPDPIGYFVDHSDDILGHYGSHMAQAYYATETKEIRNEQPARDTRPTQNHEAIEDVGDIGDSSDIGDSHDPESVNFNPYA